MWFLCTTIFFPVLLVQNHFEDIVFCAPSCEFTKNKLLSGTGSLRCVHGYNWSACTAIIDCVHGCKFNFGCVYTVIIQFYGGTKFSTGTGTQWFLKVTSSTTCS